MGSAVPGTPLLLPKTECWLRTENVPSANGVIVRSQARGGKASPQFHWQQTGEDEGELAGDEERQSFERHVGETMAVQADVRHVG